MIALVAGARPNFVKLAPILREMDRRGIPTQYIHTLQHEGAMDLSAELGMRAPDVALSNTKPGDLDSILMALTRHWAKAPRPVAVVVVGDVTSTLAAALAATAHGIPIVHVEAGLRSGDFDMPEERNRIIVDRLSDLRLTTEPEARESLIREEVTPLYYPGERWRGGAVVFAGNVMIDSLRWAERENDARELQAAARLIDAGYATIDQLAALKAAPSRPYALVTTHRPSNVDTDEAWERTQAAVRAIVDQHIETVWVRHPRWSKPLSGTCWTGGLRMLEPMPYVDMVAIMKHATLVATDSGGVQEETTALGVPCLTLRENTERPITVTEGTNTIVGLDPDRVGAEVRKILAGDGKRGRIPEGWDGHAAERIVDAIQRRYT